MCECAECAVLGVGVAFKALWGRVVTESWHLPAQDLLEQVVSSWSPWQCCLSSPASVTWGKSQTRRACLTVKHPGGLCPNTSLCQLAQITFLLGFHSPTSSLLPLRDRLLAGLAVLRRGTRSPPPPLPGVGSRLRVHTTGRGVSPSRAPFS